LGEDFEARLESGRQLINQLINDLITDSFAQAVELWKAGFSTRIIEELTGVSRSKISRYVNEADLARIDDKNTQNRKNRVYQCQKLHKMGFSRLEIADELGVNPRTVDSYFKELGLKSKTKIRDLE
jgi:predicted transcriptional regulator